MMSQREANLCDLCDLQTKCQGSQGYRETLSRTKQNSLEILFNFRICYVIDVSNIFLG